GRATLSGTITRADSTPAGSTLDLDAKINDVRLRDATATLLATAPLNEVDNDVDNDVSDGLASGEFHISGSLNQPRIEGHAAVRLAQVAGLQIEAVTAQLVYEQTAAGPRALVSAVSGMAEGTPFTGAFELDASRNSWNAKFAAEGLGTERLLDAVAARSRQAKALRDLRLHGTLRAAVDIGGTLRDAAGDFNLMPQTGTIALDAAALRWRGRSLGTVTARLALHEGVLRTDTLELRREEPATPATAAPATAAPATAAPAVALVSVAGDLPVSLDTPDLNAQITVDNERLAYVLETLTEIQSSLSERGEHIKMLDRILKTVRSLPPGLDARLALDARLTGRWRQPTLAVKRLSVTDTYARLGAGGKRLPTLEASFVYDNGFVSVQGAELRLASGDPEREDTLLRIAEGGRIVPGGEVSLAAEVLNANLSQVAPWVPALQDAMGKAVLHGDLSQFTFRVTGTMDNPAVSGSILGENLVFQNYNLDRLRLAQFSIQDGEFRIEPGDLTVVKGSFQSSAASGHVPWSWGEDGGALGPRSDAPLEIHLPLQRKDFGALAGVFVPALSNADAAAFSGSVHVTGTLENPRVGGEVTIEDGRFRLNPAAVAFDAGVTNLSGTLRFVNGRQLQIDPANILRGRFVPAESVEAPSTGNLPAEQRNPRAAKRSARGAGSTPPKIGGVFTLRGEAGLDLQMKQPWTEVQKKLLQVLREGDLQNFIKYNLLLSIDDGAYATDDFSGIHDVTAGVLWRTQERPDGLVQNVRWMLSAYGSKPGRSDKGKNARPGNGQLLSFASVNLAPGFTSGVDTLLRSPVVPFSGAEDFKDMGVFQKFAALHGIESLQGKLSRISLQSFPFSIRNAARGLVDGTLILDNGPATIPVAPASPAARPALTSTARPRAGAGALEVQAAPAVPRGGVPPGGVPPGAGLPV
ncbi:MAG TPA: hypothetical protein VNA16_04550, partial [Abditibacteriaceae bacterium]|nr:hypothetical protein [Abditibacteriaceae bacterium]